MMASSPICLLSKASKTKSWLWHRRLFHLNFGAINHLARHGLVRVKLQLLYQLFEDDPSTVKETDRRHQNRYWNELLVIRTLLVEHYDEMIKIARHQVNFNQHKNSNSIISHNVEKKFIYEVTIWGSDPYFGIQFQKLLFCSILISDGQGGSLSVIRKERQGTTTAFKMRIMLVCQVTRRSVAHWWYTTVGCDRLVSSSLNGRKALAISVRSLIYWLCPVVSNLSGALFQSHGGRDISSLAILERVNSVLRIYGLYTLRLLDAACKKVQNLLKKGLLLMQKTFITGKKVKSKAEEYVGQEDQIDNL
ncbi:integrase, catalytic region, zinc finger, CCHC-type containing protein [Tanacetum coccineum]